MGDTTKDDLIAKGKEALDQDPDKARSEGFSDLPKIKIRASEELVGHDVRRVS